MNTHPVAPANITFDADGTPRSPDHADIYHPSGGALAQAEHVFLHGNDLPQRWRGRRRFVVLETGFGLGNNFLATWAAWRADAERCAQLHFISVEAAPPTRADLERVARAPPLRALAAELVHQWPPLTWNMHRLVFEGGDVELLLAFGDVAAWLPQVTATVDAFYLDGFAPARNAAMWEPRLFRAMARLAAVDATVATWTAARGVRDALLSAGFAVRAAAGIGGKRDITLARFAPRYVARPLPRRAAVMPSSALARDVPVVIVGAGLAGCMTASALAEHGVSSIVLERGGGIATEGSGNAAGLFHGVVHRVDGIHARFHRAAALAASTRIGAAIADGRVRGGIDGVLRLQIDGDGRDIDAMQATIDRLGLPADYVRAVSAAEASTLAGVPLAWPAWFFSRGGWVDPRALARDALARAGGRAATKLGAAVASLQRRGDLWELRDAASNVLATASAVVLANAGEASSLLGQPAAWPMTQARGQLSAFALIDAARGSAAPRRPVVGYGYVLPAIDGHVWFGAAPRPDDDDPAISTDAHLHNLARLRAMLLEPTTPLPDVQALSGRVGLRWNTDDRLPLVGAVPAALAASADSTAYAAPSRQDQPWLIPRASGLFVLAGLGSRGIAASILGARVIAAQIVGSPAPLEADLLDAIDPARFLSRAHRHRD